MPKAPTVQTIIRPGVWLLLGALALIGLVSSAGLGDLAKQWLNNEAYGHGFIVALISLYLLLERLGDMPQVRARGQVWGSVAFTVCALLLLLSAAAQIHTFNQYLLLLAIACLALAAWGYPALRTTAPPLLLLLFAVPLPNFLQTTLTADLQLVSSRLGVAALKQLQVPVFLEGNVIDLGTYKLQVVEACAGLNYLYPLLGIAFLCSCYLRTPWWQRLLVILAAIPITVALNGIRIALTGVLVARFGIESAEGFLHFFEGWLIFVAALLLLMSCMWFLARMVNGHRLRDDLVLNFALPVGGSQRLLSTPQNPHLFLCITAAAAIWLGHLALGNRPEMIPSKPPLALFPMELGRWSGISQSLPPENLPVLQLSDYALTRYQAGKDIDLFIAYYDSQKNSGGMHSPKICLPGGGWDITALRKQSNPFGNGLNLNRAVLQRGLNRQLVYYWFQQGGHTFANELVVKADIFRRSLLDNRTNGALIRISTPIDPNEAIEAAEQRLAEFIGLVHAKVGSYIPH